MLYFPIIKTFQGGILIYEQILHKQLELEKQIQNIQSQLQSLPEGKLVCCHAGPYCKWYNYLADKRVYISKKQKELSEKLALKKYLLLQLKELSHEKKALDSYLKHHSTKPSDSAELLTDNPDFQQLLAPFFKPISDICNEWLAAPYEKNIQYPEFLIHKSISGNLLRSKSEALIDMLLFTNKIPFRYECALSLNDLTFFPDFTILHPKTGQIYYWEHFGMMDNPSYRQKTFEKLQIYANFGLLPFHQLITTYETKNSPLNMDTVQNIIQNIFLHP